MTHLLNGPLRGPINMLALKLIRAAYDNLFFKITSEFDFVPSVTLKAKLCLTPPSMPNHSQS